MRIISQSYFVKERYLANITSLSGEVSELTDLQGEITLKEVDYLEEFFGYELAKVIITALDLLPGTPLPSRIADIITGAEFTDRLGRLQKWKGLQRADLISPIADYVYYYWRRDHISDTTIAGEIVNDPESSVDIGAAQKMVTVWNYGVEQNRILREFMYVNLATYPEYRYWLNFAQTNLCTPINTFGI